MRLATLTVLGLISFAASANAAVFQNGSFETGTVDPGGGFITLNGGDSTSITGWTVGGNSVDYVGGYWQADDGSRSIDLSGNANGSISQTFDTVANQTYLLTFALSGNPDGGPQPKTGTLQVDVSSMLTPLSYAAPAGQDKMHMDWATQSVEFTATSASTTLTFASTTGTPYGLALDAVSVSAVPLPASLPMFGGALLALVGFAAFQHHRKRSGGGLSELSQA